MVYTHDSKSCLARDGGSTPPSGTKTKNQSASFDFYVFVARRGESEAAAIVARSGSGASTTGEARSQVLSILRAKRSEMVSNCVTKSLRSKTNHVILPPTNSALPSNLSNNLIQSGLKSSDNAITAIAIWYPVVEIVPN